MGEYKMKLSELRPEFLSYPKFDGNWYWKRTVDFSQAYGICFLCPKCFIANGGPAGTHSVICWEPEVSKKISPKPGRWIMIGTGVKDLTLTGIPNETSDSVLLTTEGGCKAHFFVREGKIKSC